MINKKILLILSIVISLCGCSTKINMTSTPDNARVYFKGKSYNTPFYVKYSNMWGRKVSYSVYKENYKGVTGFFPPKGGDIHVDLLPILYKHTLKEPDSEFIYIESSFPLNTTNLASDEQAEIIFSKEFRRYNKIKKVALKAPDSCMNKSSLSTDVRIDESQGFIENRCSVEMNLIEKEFIKHGFSVYSWEMLYNSVRLGSQSYLTNAKKLGADVLFIINSIESLKVKSNNLLTKRDYFKGNNNFEKGTKLNLSKEKIECLGSILYDKEKNLVEYVFGSSINITAVEVKTGKSFWFYQNDSYSLNDNSITTFIKVNEDKSNGKLLCSLYEKEKPIEGDKSTSYHFRSSVNNEGERKLKAIKKAISDFIQSFITGKTS